MKYYYYGFMMLVMFFLLPSFLLFGQKILVVEKPGTVINYKYRVNGDIYLRVRSEKNTIKGTINKLSDSSLVINYTREIKLKDITDIYRPMWIKKWLPELLLKASIGYFIVVGVNNILQHVYPVVPADLLGITAGLAGGSILAYHLLERHYDLSGQWRIRILDFEKLE